MSFLFVGLGGALGAICRYALSLISVKSDFPLMTFIANFAGAIFIGLIVGFAAGMWLALHTNSIQSEFLIHYHCQKYSKYVYLQLLHIYSKSVRLLLQPACNLCGLSGNLVHRKQPLEALLMRNLHKQDYERDH